MSIQDDEKLIAPLLHLVQQVSNAVLAIYLKQEEDLALELKKDGSPLTQADLLANQMIKDCLVALTPDIPILSEEACDISFYERSKWQRYWLIDPIDGTKEFLDRNGDFTINIALIEKHHPVLGVVCSPVRACSYYALKGQGAYKVFQNQTNRIYAKSWQAEDTLHVIASRRHGQEKFSQLLEAFPHHEVVHCGSSLKFCLLAEGVADLYPRLGLTSEWDTAAAQCVLEEAGGKVVDLHGMPLLYNTRDSLLNPYFIAMADEVPQWWRYFQLG